MEVSGYLLHKLIGQYGEETAQRIIEEGFSCRRKTTLRTNRLKAAAAGTGETLTAAGIAWRGVQWFEDAFVLEDTDEQAVQGLTAYREGALYLQNLSSMIPPLLLDAQPGDNVLDMAAAPGGKTMEIASLTEGRAMITACERNTARMARMKANLERQGVRRVTALNMDARQLDDLFSFDRVLLDAPCSGSGTVGSGNRGRFEETLLKKTSSLQRQLLHKAVRLTRKGGRLVYSTCSILKEENEEVVRSVLNMGCRLVPVDEARYVAVPRLPCALEGTLLIRPTEEYEGFFAAVLQKTE